MKIKKKSSRASLFFLTISKAHFVTEMLLSIMVFHKKNKKQRKLCKQTSKYHQIVVIHSTGFEKQLGWRESHAVNQYADLFNCMLCHKHSRASYERENTQQVYHARKKRKRNAVFCGNNLKLNIQTMPKARGKKMLRMINVCYCRKEERFFLTLAPFAVTIHDIASSVIFLLFWLSLLFLLLLFFLVWYFWPFFILFYLCEYCYYWYSTTADVPV